MNIPAPRFAVITLLVVAAAFTASCGSGGGSPTGTGGSGTGGSTVGTGGTGAGTGGTGAGTGGTGAGTGGTSAATGGTGAGTGGTSAATGGTGPGTGGATGGTNATGTGGVAGSGPGGGAGGSGGRGGRGGAGGGARPARPAPGRLDDHLHRQDRGRRRDQPDHPGRRNGTDLHPACPCQLQRQIAGPAGARLPPARRDRVWREVTVGVRGPVGQQWLHHRVAERDRQRLEHRPVLHELSDRRRPRLRKGDGRGDRSQRLHRSEARLLDRVLDGRWDVALPGVQRGGHLRGGHAVVVPISSSTAKSPAPRPVPSASSRSAGPPTRRSPTTEAPARRGRSTSWGPSARS